MRDDMGKQKRELPMHFVQRMDLVNPLPGRQLAVKAAISGSHVSDAFGILAKKNTTKIVLSIEEIESLTWAPYQKGRFVNKA
ncbi:MAG: hypothetical protein H5U29_07155 [Pusillimonas sp.]|nr:hypothetical protein [Pusillimonas sp.]HCN73327.1 hypothetical protein [Pusillimonas sp.]